MNTNIPHSGNTANTFEGIHQTVNGCCNLSMDENSRQRATRAKNTIDLIKHRFGGNYAAFARKVERSPSQINDMLADPPRKPFGEKLARSFEKQLGLAHGTLDLEHPFPPELREPEGPYSVRQPSEEALRVANAWDRLPIDLRSHLLGIIQYELTRMRITWADR